MKFSYDIVTRSEDMGQVVDELAKHDKFALDLETTGLDYMRDNIHGVALATNDMAWYICLGAEKTLLPLLPELTANRTVIMHNAIFDMHFLGRYNIRPPHIVDTMIGQALVDENQGLGLKSLARTKLGVLEALPDFKDLLHLSKKLTGQKRLADVTIFDVPLVTLGEYAARDARLTYDLWPITEYELAKEGALDLFWKIEMPFVYVLLDMESNGFYINQRTLQEIGKEFAAKKQEAYDLWMQRSGGVNPNSPKQLQAYLFLSKRYKPSSMTKSGGPSTDVLALTRLLPGDKNSEIAALLDYRRYDKLIGTYITTFQEQLFNGRLHGNFNQTGAVTWRLSSSGPNMQNIPGRGETGAQVRSLFAAPPGYVIVVIDYSQIELRILAHYTKDEHMLKVFEDGLDPHQMTADLLSIERKYAKSVNFGWIYGIGPKGLQDYIEKASKVRPDLADTKEWLNNFSSAYPGATAWKNRVIEYARQLGFVKTIGGHRRHLPDLNSHDTALRSRAERQAVNAIIQGSAGDIIKHAMLRIGPLQKQYNALLLAQVHDELVWQVTESSAQEFANLAGKIMVEAGEYFGLRVKLIAEPGTGMNWAEAK